MRPLSSRLAIAGATIGLAIAATLVLTASARRGAGTAGENVQWLLTYAYVAGAPISLALAWVSNTAVSIGLGIQAQYAIVLAAIPLNWGIIGWIAGWLISTVKSRI